MALQYHLAKRFGLIEILDQAAGKRGQGISVGLATVLMAIHRNSDPGSKLSFLDWYPNTILPELTGVPGKEVAYHDLLSSMDYWKDSAIAQAETDITLQLGKAYRIRFHTLAWDASSCYFDAKVNEIVQFGYSRDHRPDRPQIGTDMFIDPESGFAPYARSYEGNKADVTRFPEALQDFQKQYPDLHEVTILMDRGPASESNLVLLRQLQYHVIAGLPFKGQWADLIEKGDRFETRFNFKGTRFESKVLPVHLEAHPFFVHVYYNHKNAQQEQTCLRQAGATTSGHEGLSERVGGVEAGAISTQDLPKDSPACGSDSPKAQGQALLEGPGEKTAWAGSVPTEHPTPKTCAFKGRKETGAVCLDHRPTRFDL